MQSEIALPNVAAAPEVPSAPPRLVRARLMVRTGTKMMFHDRLKLAATVFGVVFAVLICVQQVGVLLGLLSKNTMFVEQSKADVWILEGLDSLVFRGSYYEP